MNDDLTGQDWTADELDLVVADYYRMLRAELAGDAYSKTEYRNALMQLMGRSKGSIDAAYATFPIRMDGARCLRRSRCASHLISVPIRLGGQSTG